jgi:hypothetical protein
MGIMTFSIQALRAEIVRRAAIGTALALACSMALASAGAQQNNPAVDQKAIKALMTMGDFLRQQQKFTVNLVGTKDQVLPNGLKVTFGGTVNYEVSRPNGLHASMKTDRKVREIFYDGKTLTIYAPRMKYYASAPAPSTIHAMMDSAAKRFGIEFPLGDLFAWGSDPSVIRNIQFASYIGPAEIDGTRCDQFVIRQGDVDWQVWIQQGNTPLPRKFVITTTSEPTDPSYTATLTWNLSPTIASNAFAFAPPADAKKIKLTEATVRVARTKP